MTLRCPECGSRRLTFASTTATYAVLSTDQRYVCKDCGYMGSLAVDESARAPDKTDQRILEDLEATKRSLDKK